MYDKHLKDRILGAVLAGATSEEAAARFSVSTRLVTKIRACYRAHGSSVAPPRPRQHRRDRMPEAHVKILEDALAEKNDLHDFELQRVLYHCTGRHYGISTINRAVSERLDHSRKLVSESQ